MRVLRATARGTGVLDWLDEEFRRRPVSVTGHLRSLMAIHDVDDMVRLDVPWWTYGVTAVVERHLDGLGGRGRVFEYGSGASTVWLARRATRVYSVEHNAGFVAVVRRLLVDAGLADRAEVLEVAPVQADHPHVPSGRRGEEGRDYAGYVSAIDHVGGGFDLVVVDGRARTACLDAARSRLAPGGIVLFDDSQRRRYAAGLAGCGLRVERFHGWAPAMPYTRESAVLRLP